MSSSLGLEGVKSELEKDKRDLQSKETEVDKAEMQLSKLKAEIEVIRKRLNEHQIEFGRLETEIKQALKK